MPQASSKLRKKWGWPDNGTVKATTYLKKRGWALTKRWTWMRLDGRTKPTKKEWSAMQYLIHEWDYGGIEYK